MSSKSGKVNLLANLLRAFVVVISVCSLVLGSFWFAPAGIPVASAASYNVTGTVFRDFNANGILDTGTTIVAAASPFPALGERYNEPTVANAVVKAYDASGALVGSTTTAANGTYSITIASGNPVRVEFTLPATLGFLKEGAESLATGSASSIAFATSASAVVNYGINDPSQYCEQKPALATSCYQYGPTPANTTRTLLRYNYDAINDTGTQVDLAQDAQIGQTFGLAYERTSDSLFAGTFIKRHAGIVRTNGTGAIYRIPTAKATPGTPVVFTTITNTGANPHVADGGDWSHDPNSFDPVGKVGLGGLAYDDANNNLYAMNLNDKKLYVVQVTNLTTTPTAGTVTSYATPTGLTGCVATTDERPFAVSIYDGLGYIGMVCSAQSTGTAGQLAAYVYSFPLTGALTFTKVFQAPLNYTPRGQPNVGTPLSGNWGAWTTAFSTTNTNGGFYIHPEPMLTGISFDNGNMVLGLRDRSGDTTAGNTQDDPATNTTYSVRTAGDILRACGSPTAGWTLETNAACGGVTSGGAGNAQGPGNGEYYYQDFYSNDNTYGAVKYHDEVSMGALTQVPGHTNVVVNVFDPLTDAYNGNATFDGGPRWFNNAESNANAGKVDRAYRVYNANGDVPNDKTFGKANGLGGITALCSAAPVEIGNRVWIDTNQNGIQDPGEPPVVGATVSLYDTNGTTLIGTAKTDANGNYLFSSDPTRASTTNAIYNIANLKFNTSSYTVKLDNATDYTAGNPLFGVQITSPNAQATGRSNAESDLINSKGTLTTIANPIGAGNYPTATVNTSGPGANNHAIDFGFQANVYSLGNRVWYDENNDGTRSGGTETGIANVRVNLLNNTGASILDGSGNPVFTTTDANGYYLFPNLVAGSYIVQIAPTNFATGGVLIGYNASGTVVNAATNTTDNRNNGTASTTPSTNGIKSGIVTLGPGANAPTGEADLGPGNTGGVADGESNLTLDFGFYKLTVGNQLWYDANNDGTYQPGSESPVPAGVTVQLYDSTNALIATTTTDSSGQYLFDRLAGGNGLVPGTYYVRVPTLPTGATAPSGSVVAGDNGNKGTGSTPTNSANFTLTPGVVTGNQTLPGNGVTAQPTIDFGFKGATPAFSLGNRVWYDVNNDGTRSGGTETGIANVRVNLLDGAGNAVLDSSGNPIFTTTDSNGYYLFTNLVAGNYIAQIAPSNFTAGGALIGYNASTTVTTNGTDDRNNGTPSTTPSTNGIKSAVVTLGPSANAPTGETDTGPGGTGGVADGQSNLTVDFGFYKLTVGNQLWFDTNNNGIYNVGTESPVPAGVTVQLYDSANNLIATTTTDNNGQYLFDRLAGGSGIVPGTYYVKVPTLPAGATAPSGTVVAGDNGNKGIGTTSAQSANFTLAVGVVTGNQTLPGNGVTSQPTIDFGFQGASTTFSLGNRVWYDVNNDGTHSGGTETGIANVRVNLLDGAGNAVLDSSGNPIFTTTDSNGYYLFTNLVAGNYTVQIAPSNFTAGGVLIGYNPSTTTVNSSSNTTDDRNNGITNANPATNGIKSAVVTLGPSANAPTGEADSGPGGTGGVADGQSNLTVDFGFYKLTVGNQLWFDTNNNGTYDTATESPVPAGVTVQLYDSGNNLIATTTTDNNGQYLFDRLTNGNGLVPGTYFVRVPTLPTGATGPSGTVVAGDNGNKGTGSTPTNSANFTLTPGVVTGNQTLPGSGVTAQPTIDFGFQGASATGISVGNRVFYDVDNNGTRAAAETGVSGVTVQLLDNSNAVVATTTTDANGYYLFNNLTAGAGYKVRIAASNFTSSGVLVGYNASSTVVNTATNTTDDRNNGTASTTPSTNGIVSAAFTLTANAEPTGEGDLGPNGTGGKTDNNSDLTVDFGFYKLTVGNQLWYDTNNNGIYDTTTESPVGAGVTVQLYDSTNTLIATTTTDSSGMYLFDRLAGGNGLQPGTSYYVKVPSLPSGATAPSGTVTAGDNNNKGTGTTSSQSAPFTLTPGVTTGNQTLPGNGVTSQPTYDFGFQGAPPTGISLGNRVWFDVNNNGTLDAGETGISGIKVELINNAGTVLASTTTDSNGYYLMNNLSAGTQLRVRIAASNFASGGALVGYNNSSTVVAADSGNKGSPNTNPVSLGIVSAQFSLSAGGEPIGEADLGPTGTGGPTDANSDLTRDFGFYKLTVGNQLWYDTNNNGTYDTTTESPVGAGVTVQLYDSANNLIATTTTDSSGQYLFDRLPNGNGLVPGTYYVKVPTLPSGATAPSGAVVAGDNGNKGTGTTSAQSGNFTLAPGVTTGNQTLPGNGVTAQPTYDFGFQGAPTSNTLSLGNRVFYDVNNDGTRAGATETGIGGVALELLSSNNNVVKTTTTDSNGYYLFNGLNAATYKVRIAASNFAANGVLLGYNDSSSVVAGDNGNKGSPDPNPATNGITSGAIVLASGTAPTGEADLGPNGTGGVADNNSNLTADFGFYKLSVGSQLWYDLNNDGIYQPGSESPLGSGVTIQLIDASSGLVVATTTTDGNGQYVFDHLATGAGLNPQSIYSITIPNPPTGLSPSSTRTSGVDNQNNGKTTPNGVQSQNFSVAPGATSNGQTLPGNGNTFQPTLDFGFVPKPTAARLAYFGAINLGSSNGMDKVRVEWTTQTETNNLGFNVYYQTDGKAKRTKLNDKLIASTLITGRQPQNYQFETKVSTGGQFYLEAVDMTGQTDFFSPVGSNQTTGAKPSTANTPRRTVLGPGRQPRSTTLSSTPSVLQTEGAGLYRLTYDYLVSQGLDFTGVPADQLTLRGLDGGVKLRIVAANPSSLAAGDYFEFEATAFHSIYTDYNAYTLGLRSQVTNGGQTEVVNARRKPVIPPTPAHQVTTRIEQNRFYWEGANGNTDPWMWEYLTTYTPQQSDRSYSFDLTNLEAGSTASNLKVHLQGWLTDPNLAQNHRVHAWVNGTDVGQVTFGGTDAATLTFSGAISGLQATGNTLRLQAQTVSGGTLPYDTLLFDYAELTYSQTSLPLKTELGGARPSQANPLAAVSGADYVIVTPSSLQGGVAPLVNLHTAEGLRVKVATTEAIYDAYSQGRTDANAIRSFLTDVQRAHALKYVLLVGSDSYDPMNYYGKSGQLTGAGSAPSLLPTFYTLDNYHFRAPTDSLYATGPVIGRLPAASSAELTTMVNKTVTLANGAKANSLSKKAFFVSDAGGDFNALNDKLATTANGGGYAVTKSYVDQKSLTQVHSDLVNGVNTGSLFLNYAGHSGTNAWGWNTFLNENDVQALTNNANPLIVLQWSCFTNYYTAPDTRGIGETWLTANGGAAFVVGSTAESLTVEQDQIASRFYQNIFDKKMTLGQALAQAKVDAVSANPSLQDVASKFVILGDPALKV